MTVEFPGPGIKETSPPLPIPIRIETHHLPSFIFLDCVLEWNGLRTDPGPVQIRPRHDAAAWLTSAHQPPAVQPRPRLRYSRPWHRTDQAAHGLHMWRYLGPLLLCKVQSMMYDFSVHVFDRLTNCPGAYSVRLNLPRMP